MTTVRREDRNSVPNGAFFAQYLRGSRKIERVEWSARSAFRPSSEDKVTLGASIMPNLKTIRRIGCCSCKMPVHQSPRSEDFALSAPSLITKTQLCASRLQIYPDYMANCKNQGVFSGQYAYFPYLRGSVLVFGAMSSTPVYLSEAEPPCL